MAMVKRNHSGLAFEARKIVKGSYARIRAHIAASSCAVISYMVYLHSRSRVVTEEAVMWHGDI
jgi:hypothetical protein